MIKDNEFAREYSSQLVNVMTLEQREKAFKFLESFFDETTLNRMKDDAQSIMHERAELDRRIAELDSV